MKCCLVSLLLIANIALSGCGSSTEAPSASHHADHADEHSHGDEHAHSEEGPHHGALIELGNEEYHAEFVHDDAAGTVMAYVLDSSAKLAVPISATKILVNLSHDEQAEQFALVASPQSTDAPGTSSRFVSRDSELCEELDHEDGSAQLVVVIQGRQYRGKIEHHHEGHDGHDHHDKMSQKLISIK